MQLLNPELKEIQRRYKGDRVKIQQAQQQLYAERGISPLSGCLPILLVTLPLIPLYSVFSAGLSNYNPQAMLTVFGRTIVDLNCSPVPTYNELGHVIPCLDPVAWGIDWSQPLVLFHLGPFGISLLGLLAGALMFLQSRMSLPSATLVDTTDPNQRIQRQMGAIFPLIYVFLGGTWPAGLLLYIVFSTIFSIAQQYLFTGWGGMFPIFGWQPAFAAAHTPRFPINLPPPVDPKTRPPTSPLGGAAGKAAAVDKTIRHKERGRQGRRGRRR
jgi:YidC/Oxa1 family membrane protein insertase